LSHQIDKNDLEYGRYSPSIVHREPRLLLRDHYIQTNKRKKLSAVITKTMGTHVDMFGLRALGKVWTTFDRLFWARQAWRHAHLPPWCGRILFSVRDPWEVMVRSGFVAYPEVMLEFSPMTEDTVQRADLVVPFEFSDLVWLADRPHLVKGKPIPIPSRALVDLCHDKRAFNNAVRDLGFASLIPAMDGLLTFPYIVKPLHGECSHGTHVIASAEDEALHANVIADPTFFRQHMLPGQTEYATHMAIRRGKVMAEITMEYRFAVDAPVKGKDRLLWRRATPCPDSETLANVLRALGFEGICCFNFKMIGGQLRLIELNPRFGGSLAPHFARFLAMMA
jgi:hypothetical protein